MSFQGRNLTPYKNTKQLQSGVKLISSHLPEKPTVTNFTNGKSSICNILSFTDGCKVLKLNLIVIARYIPDENKIETLKDYTPACMRAIKKFAEVITVETGIKPSYHVPDRYKAEVLTT